MDAGTPIRKGALEKCKASRSKGRGRGLFRLLRVIGCATLGLKTQSSCDVPLMGTSNGDSPPRKFPHFVGGVQHGASLGRPFRHARGILSRPQFRLQMPQGRVTSYQLSAFWRRCDWMANAQSSCLRRPRVAEASCMHIFRRGPSTMGSPSWRYCRTPHSAGDLSCGRKGPYLGRTRSGGSRSLGHLGGSTRVPPGGFTGSSGTALGATL